MSDRAEQALEKIAEHEKRCGEKYEGYTSKLTKVECDIESVKQDIGWIKTLLKWGVGIITSIGISMVLLLIKAFVV